MANNEMKSMIKELKEYKLLKEEAEARIAELENELKAERSRLTGEISGIRKDIKTAEFTLERSEKVQDDIKIELSYCKGDKHRSQKRDNKNRGVDR